MRPCHPRGRAVPNPLWTLCPRWWPRASSGRPHQQLRTVKEKGKRSLRRRSTRKNLELRSEGKLANAVTQLTNWRKDAKYFKESLIESYEIQNSVIEWLKIIETKNSVDNGTLLRMITSWWQALSTFQRLQQKAERDNVCHLLEQKSTKGTESFFYMAELARFMVDSVFWKSRWWCTNTMLQLEDSSEHDFVDSNLLCYFIMEAYLQTMWWIKIIFRNILCIAIIGLTKSGRAACRRRKENISVLCWF